MQKVLQNSEKIRELQHALQKGDSILIEELWNAPKALVAALAQQTTGKHILILTGGTQEESRLFHDFTYFSDRPVVDFPAWETLPNENLPPSPDIVGERYEILKEILNDKEPRIVISHLQACLQRLIQPQQFEDLYWELQVGDTWSFDELVEQLGEMGYVRKPVASDKGEFAIRGGILDLFPVSSPDPFRIEFWGDDIESIRTYDPIGQKSVHAVERVEITAAKEMELLSKTTEMSTILDYLGKETVVIFDDLLALEDRYASLVNICGKATGTFCGIEEFIDRVKNLQTLFWSPTAIEKLCDVKILDRPQGGFYSDSTPIHGLEFQMFNRKLSCQRWSNPFVPLGQYLIPEKTEGEEITGDEILLSLPRLDQQDHLHFLCSTESEELSLKKRVMEYDLKLPSDTQYHLGYLSTGFVLPDVNQVIVPMTEITHRYKIRRQKLRSTYHSVPSEVFDLTPGEMVVHLNNGIGKYIGIERKANHQGVETEFLQIEYADQAKLYVPIDQAHHVSKYIGSTEEAPKMHKLGSTRWKRAKESTERAILGYASDLLQVYAKRELSGGFNFGEDGDDLQSFEEEFPYAETQDQLSAVASIKEDMKSGKSMDRLICGDVGYGKTEVAMRAAFKAVIDGGKQVAVLVPTTVLAMQHYDNFLERMSNFPITVEVLSRFRTAKQVKKAIEGLMNGTVDIIIGTHRLISKDIHFKNLGLVVIDEEQRFGVRAKEHLKKLKTGVDCITLSATPIPRTLYMSLIGARDMSVINTPPQDRVPIKTMITTPNEKILKNALLRELARDGQVYYIHNRVETIYSVGDRLKKLLPQARVAVAHGQMHSDELDTVFHAFKSGQVDILVATTIVENGIDIPNANTILIDDADHFGLATLYQLRGRVGRWNRRAYAYFLVKKPHLLPEVTRKRMNALAEASGYGGGMKLAMRDLEIRGAGDILGTEQSGHVASIGFHLYCKLLKRTIRALEGTVSSMIADTKIEHSLNARLPEEYVNETSLRMEIYQRLGDAVSWEEVDEIWSEMKDRFGAPPDPVLWLYHLTRVRVYASIHGFTLIKIDKLSLTLERKKGKETITTKSLFAKHKSPQDLEEKLIEAMKKV